MRLKNERINRRKKQKGGTVDMFWKGLVEQFQNTS